MNELYPKSPRGVPADYTRPSKAYRRRALLAVACVLGFFGLYLGATGWFGYKAYQLGRAAWVSGSFQGGLGSGLAGFFFVVLAKGVLPDRRASEADEVEVTAADEPALFAFIHCIADEAGAPRPHKVVLEPHVGAAVCARASLLSLLLPPRKSLVIGVGLVNALTLTEFKAVLAHEFGHFAQRTMAVGRWVYVAQSVAARIVVRRGFVDRLLEIISSIEMRIAVVGWILRLLLWSVRAIIETFFRLVIVAERALSREMELQADRVSVSLAGSDALVHALFRLRAADKAWSEATTVAGSQLRRGKRVPDLYALQDLALAELRRIFGDTTYGDVPPIPNDAPGHRIFTPSLAQPPVMWSTHPSSHVREVHAKEVYIPGVLDERSAWLLFTEPEALRTRITERELETWDGPEDARLLTAEDALRVARERYDVGALEPRYRGLYLRRGLTRGVANARALLADVPTDRETIGKILRDPYPEDISALAQAWRDLGEEKAQLEALRAGLADAPGGVIRHRGRTLRRRQLPAVIDAVAAELRTANERLRAVDRELRTTHQGAAASLGEPWAAQHRALLDLLHFAEHVEANADDAMRNLDNVCRAVAAGRGASESEFTRLLESARELYSALLEVWNSRSWVSLGEAVAARMKVPSWPDALSEGFGLRPPTRANLENWLPLVESWFAVGSQRMADLRRATLDVLLEVEDTVRGCWLEGREPGPVPEAASVTCEYPPFVEGAEREFQAEVDLWDRFILADGWGPGAARFVVAGVVVGFATFAGVGIVEGEVVVHNGLHRPVAVRVGPADATVPPLSREVFSLGDVETLRIEARTTDGDLIEAFTAPVDNPLGTYAYSVAGAVPLISWRVHYGTEGRRQSDRHGPARWLETSANYVFKEPPKGLHTRASGTYRTVLSALDVRNPSELYAVLPYVEPEQVSSMAMVHAKWDTMPAASWWLRVAHRDVSNDVEVHALLDARRAAEPLQVELERLAQDFAGEHGERETVCSEHREAATAEPSNPDAVYLALRCRPPSLETAQAFVDAARAHPDHGWLLAASGYGHVQLGDVDEAISALARARKLQPMMVEGRAESEARLRRLAAEDESAVNLDDLSDVSLRVRLLAGVEDESTTSDAARAFRLVDRGELEEAVRVGTEGGVRASVLRLVASSPGAPEPLVAQASLLNIDTDLSVAEGIAGVVLMHRTRGDAAPYWAALERNLGEESVEVLRAFADPERLAAEEDILERRRLLLVPVVRGHAAVLGIGMLGAEAPAHWRTDARRLLFVSERPRIEPPTD